MTRFRLSHVWHLISMYRALRAMRADLDAAPGLIRYAFLVEGPRACYTLSIWESEAALQRLINVRSHIAALRRGGTSSSSGQRDSGHLSRRKLSG
jgi:heme-degrading monooxygenase HmoA